MTHKHWFSEPFDTIEAAQLAAPYTFFDQAGIFKTADGKYVHARMSPNYHHWSSDEIYRMRTGISLINGYTLLMLTDPVVLCWCGVDGKPVRTAAQELGGEQS